MTCPPTAERSLTDGRTPQALSFSLLVGLTPSCRPVVVFRHLRKDVQCPVVLRDRPSASVAEDDAQRNHHCDEYDDANRDVEANHRFPPQRCDTSLPVRSRTEIDFAGLSILPSTGPRLHSIPFM
jgi:hypothetical protein